MVVVEEEEINGVAEFKSSFNHRICRVPADAAINQDSSVEALDAAFVVRRQHVLFQQLPSLVTPVD
ncbi:Uncharacterized protein HZ326_26255, partial [Fusarium oxysporum f. sp. albedinis]